MASRYSSRVSPEKITAFREAHPGASEAEARRALRGHGTTAEHGTATAVTVGNRTIYTTNSAQAAQRVINQAAHDGKRVSFAVNDANNPVTPKRVWENPGHGAGIDAEYLKGEIKQSGQNVKKYLEGTTFGGGPNSPGYIPSGITSMQITVYG